MAHLALGDKNQAMEESQTAVALLEGHGATEALSEEIYYNHSLIMQAQGEAEEARRWLKKAHDVIVANGNKIRDPIFRASFFSQIPLNREIVSARQAGD